MSRLTPRQIRVITTTSVLAASTARTALTPFEIDLVSEVSTRFLDHGEETAVTDAEWTALESALQGMAASLYPLCRPEFDRAGQLVGVRLAEAA